MKKKSILNTAAATLAISLSVPAIAAAAESPGALSVAPVREIATSLGTNVKWNQDDRTVTLQKGNTTLVLTIGQSTALLNGKSIPAGGIIRIKDNQALVPVSLLSDAFANASSEEEPDLPASSADTADQFYKALASGNGAEAIKLMSPALKQALPPQAIDSLWSNLEGAYGKVSGEPSKREQDNTVHHNVIYTVQVGTLPVQVTLRLNLAGQVDDLSISPANTAVYQKPAYDNPAAYTEQQVTVGQGEFALPGTLTLPAGQGPFPAVVLVHGSGPNDQDSTIGGAKPLRDIAVGLAAKGIAVLRYDKITYEHSSKVAVMPKFTLKDETVNDALAAVKLLKNTSQIDPERIYVAGHSQGGYAMPLISEADTNKSIAGTILLSGPSSKFIDVALEQQSELISRIKELGQDPAPYEQQAAIWTSIAKLLDDPQYSTSRLPENFPMPPAYWWYDQNDYKPTELAKRQSGPMLILQGENDWQVPIQEFNQWKNELKGRADVEFKSYPKVNHLLAEFDGISTGAEYNEPSNVSPAIINDIAAWINK